jgi:formyltetrahydrofolate deformylase
MTLRLLLSCPDRPGIVAAVASFAKDIGGNITDLSQHAAADGQLYMRLVIDVPDLSIGDVAARFEAEVAPAWGMSFRFAEAGARKRVAIMASRPAHCLRELLWRLEAGELEAEGTMVISNHPDHSELVTSHGLPYHHVPIEPNGKPAAERAALELLAGTTDLLVLARYMQVLSGPFLEELGCPAINIHHSFLPAFAGPDPYAQAFAQGVKLIGATAHYVTEKLDAGPIIEQDVVRVTHDEGPHEMERLGQEVERSVLMRAVRAHLEDRVLVSGQRTIVF